MITPQRSAVAVAFATLLLAVPGARAGDDPVEPIVVDGRFGDWERVPVALVDETDAPGAEIDFGEVRVSEDARYVHLLIDLGRAVSVQRLDGRALLFLDVDGNDRTGSTVHGLPGADVAVILTPPDTKDATRPGMGMGVAVIGDAGAKTKHRPSRDEVLTPYALGITFGPTYASDQIELRLERGRRLRGAPAVLQGKSFSGKLVYLDGAGSVRDETEPFTLRLSKWDRDADDPAKTQTRDPLARDGRTDLRVMSWNARYGALLQQGPIARRLVEAIDPDVILVQELTDANTAAEIASLLNSARGTAAGPEDVRRAPWRALVGAGGGNLRCAVVSRAAPMRLPVVEPIPYPNWDGKYIRTCGAVLTVNDKRLLVLSTHLKCCGRLGDSADRKREVEASAIRAAVRAAIGAGGVDAILIGGDMNLVGGRAPLDVIASGTDVDGSDLAIAAPLQLDGRSTVTWSDEETPFGPGRLDYLLFADERLELVGSFVLDTAKLAPKWLKARGLREADTMQVSDHFPVVLDLVWRD